MEVITGANVVKPITLEISSKLWNLVSMGIMLKNSLNTTEFKIRRIIGCDVRHQLSCIHRLLTLNSESKDIAIWDSLSVSINGQLFPITSGLRLNA